MSGSQGHAGHTASKHAPWQAPGFIAIVALLFLVIGFVAGTNATTPGSPLAGMATDIALADTGEDGHEHGEGDHADGEHADHAEGDHAEGEHADHGDGDHGDGAHGDDHGAGGHADHGDGDHGAGGHAAGAHGDDHGAGAHPEGDHPAGHADEHPPGEEHPPGGEHPHPPTPGPVCDFGYAYHQPTGWSEADCANAQAIIASTKDAIAEQGLSTYAGAIGAGFRSIEDHKLGSAYEHLVYWDRLNDTNADGSYRIMDPTAIESLVFRVDPDGTKVLESAMYILPLFEAPVIPAAYQSSLTPWHGHTNLCWDMSDMTVDGLSRDGVACPPGTTYFPTPPMLHVWITPTPCGPFAEVEGASGDCSHVSH